MHAPATLDGTLPRTGRCSLGNVFGEMHITTSHVCFIGIGKKLLVPLNTVCCEDPKHESWSKQGDRRVTQATGNRPRQAQALLLLTGDRSLALYLPGCKSRTAVRERAQHIRKMVGTYRSFPLLRFHGITDRDRCLSFIVGQCTKAGVSPTILEPGEDA